MRIKSKKSVAEARLRYDEGAPVSVVAQSLGFSAREFLNFRRTQGWPLRASAIPRPKRTVAPPPPSPTPPAVAAAPSRPPDPGAELEALAAQTDLAELRRRLERAVERELSAVAGRLSGASVAAGERNARLLASLVKTFAELRRMEALEQGPRGKSGAGGNGAIEDEPAPRDLEALRHELARTVERIAREGQAG